MIRKKLILPNGSSLLNPFLLQEYSNNIVNLPVLCVFNIYNYLRRFAVLEMLQEKKNILSSLCHK